MAWIITKFCITAAIVVLASEVAARSGKAGALIAALPLVTLLTLVWLYLDKQPVARIATFSTYTFWYVIPTLPLLLIFPALLQRTGFWSALLASIVLTMAIFLVVALLLRRFGIDLL